MIYSDKMTELFKNIPGNIPETKPEDYKNKRHILLTDIGGKFCINKIGEKHFPINRPRLSK